LKQIILSFFILLSFNLYAQDFGFAYCYDCSARGKKALAKSKLTYPGTKTITIINRSTRNLTTFKVIRIVEPGINTVNALEQPTPISLSDLIDDVHLMMDNLKSDAIEPIDVSLLPGYGNPNFPTVAHNLVNSNLARQWLINGVSDYLSSVANSTTLDTAGTFTTATIAKVINKIGEGELVDIEYTFKFDDGSTVVMKVNAVTIDGNSLSAIINVVQKPNSMRDSEGNPIPETAEDLSNSSYYLANPGNIAYWGSLVNRLRAAMAGFGQVCSWESENHVVCESM